MSTIIHGAYRNAVNEAIRKATAFNQAVVVWQCGSQWASVTAANWPLDIPWTTSGVIRPVLIVDSEGIRDSYSPAALVASCSKSDSYAAGYSDGCHGRKLKSLSTAYLAGWEAGDTYRKTTEKEQS